MLLNLYLGTTALTWITIVIFALACDNKLKREGFKDVKKKTTVFEEIASFVSATYLCFIPIVNIFLAMVALFIGFDKLYKELKNDLLTTGNIYLPTEETLISEETSDTKNANIEKTYSEMTLEEKLAYLEHEKEILINYSKTMSSKPIEDVPTKLNQVAQQEPVLKLTLNTKNK